MTAPPLWTILIPTIGQRGGMFTRLMDGLLPQTEPYGGKVTVLALWNNGERSLADIRDRLMEEATSRYTCFADDDDELPPYYVERVVPLLDGVDYVGWKQQVCNDGVLMEQVVYSYRHGSWYQAPDGRGWRQDIVHLNPVRRELALAHARFAAPNDFSVAGWEDIWWGTQMRPHVKTEHFVPDDVMYYYRYSKRQSACFGIPAHLLQLRYEPPEIEHPNFAWAAGSFW